jgi:hypothetical protein
MDRQKEAELMASAWKQNYKFYPDGTKKTFFIDKHGSVIYHLNKYGYPHRTQRCTECGEWECDIQGVRHYRG